MEPLESLIDLQPELSRSAAEVMTMWECMPSQVFRRLFTILDETSVKTVRCVCSAWKEEMDKDVGLIVKIDTRKDTNKDFLKKIAILKARVISLEDPVEDDLFLSPGSLTKLILAGKVSPSWFKSQIPKFFNLTKLVIRGGCLSNYELQLNTEESSVPICPPHIFMPSLKSLEIIANEFSYSEFFLPLAIRLRDPARAHQTEANFNEMALCVAKNISFVLLAIRSPELKMLQVFSYERPGFILPESHNWRFHPLETFLEYHKLNIRELYLPEFEGKHHLGHQTRGIPSMLSKLSIQLTFFIGDREEGRHQDSTYWKDCLTAQTELIAIDFQIIDMTQAWVTETLSSMCRNCRKTLTFIDLTIQMEENCEISCSLFEECNSLEVLRLTCRENEAFINDFTSLPTSLKKVRMTACFIVVPNPEEIKKFVNLSMLEMSIFILDGGIHERSLLVIWELLHLRNLNFLGVSFNENAGNNPAMRQILEQFSLFWDPRFRFSGMKVNYGYGLKEGWSDEFFDEEETDRDFINQREPEDLPSFGPSFYNVEDDPRVILFHNIPLLLRTIALHDMEEDHNDDEDSGLNTPDRSFHSDDEDDDDFDEFM